MGWFQSEERNTVDIKIAFMSVLFSNRNYRGVPWLWCCFWVGKGLLACDHRINSLSILEDRSTSGFQWFMPGQMLLLHILNPKPLYSRLELQSEEWVTFYRWRRDVVLSISVFGSYEPVNGYWSGVSGEAGPPPSCKLPCHYSKFEELILDLPCN